jgi:hypothetical protein
MIRQKISMTEVRIDKLFSEIQQFKKCFKVVQGGLETPAPADNTENNLHLSQPDNPTTNDDVERTVKVVRIAGDNLKSIA